MLLTCACMCVCMCVFVAGGVPSAVYYLSRNPNNIWCHWHLMGAERERERDHAEYKAPFLNGSHMKLCRSNWPGVGFLKWWTGGRSNPIGELVSLSLRARPCLLSGTWLDDMILKVRWIGSLQAQNKWNGQRGKKEECETEEKSKRWNPRVRKMDGWVDGIALRKYPSERD